MLGRLLSRPLTGGRVCRGLRRWHDVCTSGRLGQVEPNSTLPRPLRVWLRALHHRPLLCSTGSAAGAAATGDIFAQVCAYAWTCRHREASTLLPDFSRTAKYSALSALLVGMAGEVWFRSLLLKFPGVQYQVAVRAVLDLSLFGPVALGLVISTMTLWGKADCEYTAFRLSTDWFHSLGKLWAFWLSGSAVSYLFVPIHSQPLFALGLGVVWNSYISHRIHLPGTSFNWSEERQLYVGNYIREHQHGVVE